MHYGLHRTTANANDGDDEMRKLNELCEPLKIEHVVGRWPDVGSLCEIEFSDRRQEHRSTVRPVGIFLNGSAFNAAYNASREDLVAMRDWLNTAIDALPAAE